MAKEKQTRRMIAMALAAAVTMSSVPVVAFAEEGGDATPTPASAPADNTPAPVDNTPVPADNTSAANTEDNIPDVKPNEKPVAKDGPINVTISIPSQPDNPDTPDVNEGEASQEFGNEPGTVTGDDVPTDPSDNDYDYEITTEKGEVIVETTENTGAVKEYGQDDMDYVASETAPTEDNDLITDTIYETPEEYLPGNQQGNPLDTEAPAEGEDYYQYEFMGTGNTSQYRPLVAFTQPMTDEQKVAEYGDHPTDGAYINVASGGNTKHFVNWLSDEDKARVQYDENGKYVTDEAGYLVDSKGERILKAEQKITGPDGETYYLHRFNANGKTAEGWYDDAEYEVVDGESVLVEEGGWLTELNGKTQHAVPWREATQFVLVDKVTGEVITTYCADILTGTQDDFGYHIVNLEDSTYYSDEQAEQIRAIAKNGYWGTDATVYEKDENGEYKVDDNGNKIPVLNEDGSVKVDSTATGSLEAMKVAMLASGKFEADELDSLTDGVALAATQMAIWSFSNKNSGVEFVNTNYYLTPDKTEATPEEFGAGGNVPADKVDEVKLMFKLYDYLKGLDPVPANKEQPTTADTIIGENTFLKGDMEVTVLEKDEDHANNQDKDSTNDAYKANLSFALVVEPSTASGDDLVVTVVNGHGDVVAKGRVAGDDSKDKDDPTFTGITNHGNGNYSFDNITMIEGDQEFNISMEGIQNLKEGVYLFSSEVDASATSSQTMVGMASGEHNVKVSQEIKFSFDVEDEKVVVRKKHSGSKKDKDKEKDKEKEKQEEIFEEDVPLADFPGYEIGEPVVEDVEIGEEEVPMAEAPLVAGAEEVSVIAQTGDSNHMAGAFGGMFAALAGMFFLRRKKED